MTNYPRYLSLGNREFNLISGCFGGAFLISSVKPAKASLAATAQIHLGMPYFIQKTYNLYRTYVRFKGFTDRSVLGFHHLIVALRVSWF